LRLTLVPCEVRTKAEETVEYRARNTTEDNQMAALRRMDLTLNCCKSKETADEIDRGVARECVNKRGVRFEIISSYSGVEFIASSRNARPRYTERITRNFSFPTTYTGRMACSLAGRGTLFCPTRSLLSHSLAPCTAPLLQQLPVANHIACCACSAPSEGNGRHGHVPPTDAARQLPQQPQYRLRD